MNKTEISRRLALAIGYPADRVRLTGGDGSLYPVLVQVLNDNDRCDGPMQWGGWQRFDHTDPAVIWPIAERFDAFPNRWRKDECVASIGSSLRHNAVHKCAATASALAVIRHFESKA